MSGAVADPAPPPADAPLARAAARTARATAGAVGAVVVPGATALAWGRVERRLPVVRRFEVPVARPVPEVTILQISDLHLFPGQEFLVDFLRRVAATERFDVVASTGDNFGGPDGADLVREAYAPFLDRPGFFVLGSNDYYSPVRKNWGRYLVRSKGPHPRVVPDLPWTPMTRMMADAGWADLSNRAGDLEIPGVGALSLLGTDDAHIHRDRYVDPAPSWEREDVLRLGATHSPYTRVVSALTRRGADLIVAGHTHGGQIGLPGFGALITNCDIPRRYAKGLSQWHSHGRVSWLHVSAGLGTSRYARVRVATRPEVSLLHVFPVRRAAVTDRAAPPGSLVLA